MSNTGRNVSGSRQKVSSWKVWEQNKKLLKFRPFGVSGKVFYAAFYMNNTKSMLAPAPATTPHYVIEDNGVFPNSKLPVLLYKMAFNLPNDHAPGIIEEVFEDNNWSNSWRDGIFNYNHYHSNTHEVLGIYSGDCTIELGGDSGIQLFIEKGDVLVIPAGVAHRNIGSSENFKCIGAYPEGADYDINLGKAGERPGTDNTIRKVPTPKSDPLYGNEGCLSHYWRS